MAGLTKMRCIFPLRTGLAEIECWGNSPTSEIVTHPFLGNCDGKSEFDGLWVLTHRRSGKNVSNDMFPTVEAALVVANILDRIEDFKNIRVDSLEEGPTNADTFMLSLRNQIRTKLAEFASQTAVEPRPAKLTPQSDQRGSP